MTTAMCPGSFDPPTNGHIDVIGRCARRFDRVVVAVVSNPGKSPLFSLEDRIALLRESLTEHANVEFISFNGLLVEIAEDQQVDVVIKGLRAGGDFDYELQMAQMNAHVGEMETLFMPTAPAWGFVSSSLVKEVARLGGSVEALVPSAVAVALEEKLA